MKLWFLTTSVFGRSENFNNELHDLTSFVVINTTGKSISKCDDYIIPFITGYRVLV